MKNIPIKYKLLFLFSFSFIGMLILAERSFALSKENIRNAAMIFDNAKSTQHLQENYIVEPEKLKNITNYSLLSL